MEGETSMWKRYIDWLSLTHLQAGTWPATQACALDWEWNWWPLGSQASTQSPELHQPGQGFCQFTCYVILQVSLWSRPGKQLFSVWVQCSSESNGHLEAEAEVIFRGFDFSLIYPVTRFLLLSFYYLSRSTSWWAGLTTWEAWGLWRE